MIVFDISRTIPRRGLAAIGLACALLLSGCGGGAAPTWGDRQVPAVGGSAAQMGPGFCQQVPREVSRRNQWMDLCMTN